ncbi:nuclear transport factor 2 family protein [Humibacillus xanthopallidus]|uniref:Limonene-1,2-epoxide hydrolase n=1 Tax=Humibacillus xanthopallidus TaxID=412689 RepID=A0A543HGL0_9MICO|nr:nuclear transport factor 2 family protein [Humibacillus xanthopallidus]TQM57458.1 limonene-1,2-epoxide hydrolase [Humibacillus xanthopallidus]
MFAEYVVRRRMRRFLDSFEHKDFDQLSQAWAQDVIVEFPEGLPMAGAWHGKEEVRRLFESVFAYNRRFAFTVHHIAVSGAWSPMGRSTVLTEWQAEEERMDGHMLKVRVVSVAESRRWRVVRTRDYFSDVPAMAAHYEHIELPSRTSRSLRDGGSL